MGSRKTRSKRIAIAGLLGVVAFVATSCIPDGMYIVGPGCRYCAPQFLGMYWSPGGTSCYYARLRDNGGEVTSVTASVFRRRQGVQIVVVQPPDTYFETKGCLDWQAVTGPLTASPTTPKPSDADYRVNIDISPGTWEADRGIGCSWSRLSGFGHTPAEVISGGFSETYPVTPHQVVHIEATDAGFTSSGCTEWTRTGP